MISIKSSKQIDKMRESCKLTKELFLILEDKIKPGITTKELDTIAYNFYKKHGATPNFLNYNGYPATICASVNDEVVHGIPSNKIVLRDGDIISIDIPANKIELKVEQSELDERMKNFVPKKKELSGYLKRYASLVSSGASGAILN